MNIAQIENNLQKISKSPTKETFIYDLLLAYGLPKASITRLKKGNMNLSKVDGELSWKKKVLFKEIYNEDLHVAVSNLAEHVKHDQRFVIVTDFKTLLAIDTKTLDKLDIEINELPKHYDFFLPWAGMEKAQHANENPADVKAAEKMAKLFDEIKKDNPDDSPDFIHGLNVFLSRLLFCFFAEDTEIFKDGQFTNAISSHTQADGSDLNSYLDNLFEVLNTPKNERKGLPDFLQQFEYVNGGLFRQNIPAPTFTRRSRQVIIEVGELNWKGINPDIFGSMFQAVIGTDQRGSLGQHYTSVPNIMKVIEPLFLNELYETFEKAKHNPKKLNDLLHRLSKIKIFDPACGSGNFLIIAYKELRRLEIAVIKQLQELQKAASGFEPYQKELIPKSQLGLAASFQVELFSRIQLSQFYGIEIDDFAHEIAQLSLWLAEHQMNVEFKKEFGQSNPTLPLKEAGVIVQGNACRLDWEKVCPNEVGDEIYILGNPPFLGDKLQSPEQKADLKGVFKGIKSAKAIDYIGAWFLKASNYIEKNGSYAFVSTNSICQGVQVPILWPNIFNKNLEIGFAHQSFSWTNSAKSKAKVICVIVGVRRSSNKPATLYDGETSKSVSNLSPYLIEGENIIIEKRSSQISNLPLMVNGNIPRDKGNFMLSESEYVNLSQKHPESSPCLKKILGSKEFLNKEKRWCLWIDDDTYPEVMNIPSISERIQNIKEYRLNGSERGKLGADTPYKFERTLRPTETQIIIPRVSSGRRDYIPVGFLDRETIISDAALAIFDPPAYILGVLSSKMHTAWVKTTAGRLKSDYRYSIGVCYNTFPFPVISEQRKQAITQAVFRILSERERHSDKTLAQLYDPKNMPLELKEAHKQNDIAIDLCYRSRPFENDEERLEYLFKLYEKMIVEEKQKASK